MKLKKNNKIMGVILLVILGVLAGGYIEDPDNPPIITPSHDVICDVEITKGSYGDEWITDYGCYSTERKCYLSPLLFPSEGNLVIEIGTKRSQTPYRVEWIDKVNKQVSMCIPDGTHQVKIWLKPKNSGDVIDYKEMMIEVP